MACKTLLVLAVVATMASVILSSPQRAPIQTLPAEVPDEVKEVIAEYFAEKMEEGLPLMQQEIQSRTTSLFNLSAYLNTNRPNGTALTLVPLITILSGLVSG